MFSYTVLKKVEDEKLGDSEVGKEMTCTVRSIKYKDDEKMGEVKKITCKLPRQCGAPRPEDPRISSIQQDRSSPKENVCTKRNRTHLNICFADENLNYS